MSAPKPLWRWAPYGKKTIGIGTAYGAVYLVNTRNTTSDDPAVIKDMHTIVRALNERAA